MLSRTLRTKDLILKDESWKAKSRVGGTNVVGMLRAYNNDNNNNYMENRKDDGPEFRMGLSFSELMELLVSTSKRPRVKIKKDTVHEANTHCAEGQTEKLQRHSSEGMVLQMGLES